MRRSRAALLVPAALVSVAADCGGGDGSGGSPAVVRRESLDPGCKVLSSAFPPGLDFLPGEPTRIAVAEFSPSAVAFFDVTGPRPFATSVPQVLGIPDDSDGDGVNEGSGQVFDFPLLDGVFTSAPALAEAGLGLVSASEYEQVIVFRAQQGVLAEIDVFVPDSDVIAADDYPRLPRPGDPAVTRTAISTQACVKPEQTLDSDGNDYAAGLPDFVFCDPTRRGSFEAGYSSSATVIRSSADSGLDATRMFVSMSNLGSRRGQSDTQFLPGAVLIYDLDLDAQPRPRASPNADVPFLITGGFNPTHVTRYVSPDGAAFALVTVTGALGIQEDDPRTRPVEAGSVVRSEGSIEVIDVDSLERVAIIPLGLAGLTTDRLAIDPSGRVAVVGSSAGRNVFAVDLAALDGLPESLAEPVVLDEAVVFDADAPFRIPATPGGAPPESCPGWTEGAAFNHDGTRLYVTDYCDGTLTTIGVSLPDGREQSLSPAIFERLRVDPLVAPLREDTFGQARAPGALRARPGVPGVDYTGAELFSLINLEGQLCSIVFEE